MSEVTSIQAAKTYNGEIKLPNGTTETVTLKKILQTGSNSQNPLVVTYPNDFNNPQKFNNLPGLETSNSPSYNCTTDAFEAYFWLPKVTENTFLCLYQNESNNNNIYLTYHLGNVSSTTDFYLTKVTGNVNLKLKKGDGLTISMLDWRTSNPLSLRTEDPITSRGTTTTVEGGDDDPIANS